MSDVLVRTLCAGAMTLGGFCVEADAASTFETYGNSFSTIAPPPPDFTSGSFSTAGDALSDGRLIAVTGLDVFLETSAGSGTFQLAATLESTTFGGSTDPGFLRVSPDGSKIALGGGFSKPLMVIDTSIVTGGGSPVLNSFNTSVYNVGHTSAAWTHDSAGLAIGNGDFGSPAYVDLLDITSSTAAPSITRLVDGVQGASGGVAFDASGNLYVGNGYANGSGSDTGAIHMFTAGMLGGGTPLDYEGDGLFVTDMLSANDLTFDLAGNMFVGGGDLFGSGDGGYAGIINNDTLEALIDGTLGSPIDTSDLLQVRKLDPDGSSSAFYNVIFNEATGELILSDGTTWHATIPAPASYLGLAALLGIRRRSRAA
ncbi:MAG: hypothetical protein ACYTF7_11635 [Planctomycetota bacterium]|jgi:hypothetical protein